MRAHSLLLAVLVVSSHAWASSIRPTTVAERARLSDRVVRVEVVKTETVLPPNSDVRRMMTLTQVRVLDDYKGQGAATIEIFQVGGKSGLWEAHVPEDAKFEAGERAVLFLRCRDAANPGRCTLVGLKTGKLAQPGAEEAVDDRPNGAPVTLRLSDIVAEVKRAEASR